MWLIINKLFNVDIIAIKHVLYKSDLLKSKSFFALFFYYCLAIVNALFEGLGLVLVVDLFINSSRENENPIYELIENGLAYFNFEIVGSSILLVISGLFLVKFIAYASVLVADGYISANVRKRLQQAIYKRLIFSDWEFMRNISVGEAVNNNVAETLTLEKYFTSIIRLIYFSLTSLMYLLIALFLSWKITLILLLIVIPFFFIVQIALKKQAKTSVQYVKQRNIFAKDITERLNGLLQIKAGSTEHYHYSRGLEMQKPMRNSAVIIGVLQAIVVLMVSLLPVIIFLLLFGWSIIFNQDIANYTFLIASIGVIGVRSMTQFNGLVGQFAQVSRLSGSLVSVNDILKVKQATTKKYVSDKIDRIDVKNVVYNYGKGNVVNNLHLSLERGKPIILEGGSGSGKSTIANIIAGLIEPIEGNILYFSNGNRYSSDTFKIKVSYVTQDIHLFSGTFKSNLIADKKINLKEIDEILELTDAKKFIELAGGLNSTILESGKSLSGGQRRRLGIARALLENNDLIILDEIFAGLDSKNKVKIFELIKKISKNNLLLLISHDPIIIESAETIKL